MPNVAIEPVIEATKPARSGLSRSFAVNYGTTLES
jgi:hypothetical protein